jgi:hypothetical protein
MNFAFTITNDSIVVIKDEYAPYEVLPKSLFLKVDEKELDNVNRGSYRAIKGSEVWAKNAFDEW